MISASARLLRGFAVDFLTAHDVTAVERIMDPAYRLSIGGHLFDGRDDSYLPATAAQLDQFPGLCVTVHDTVIGHDAVAMRFTEHGVSARGGSAAAWGGVTMFTIADGRLKHGWAEEDYFARKRQLKAGQCDPVRPPHPSPWDAAPQAPDAETEAVARCWATNPALLDDGVVEEICMGEPGFAACITPSQIAITQLFAAGNRAAIHLECSGTYAGGFADIDAGYVRAPVTLRIAGLLDVADGRVVRAQLSADRLGLHRALMDRARAA